MITMKKLFLLLIGICLPMASVHAEDAPAQQCSVDCSVPAQAKPVDPDAAINGVVGAAEKCPGDGATALVSLAKAEPSLIAEALEAAKTVVDQSGFKELADGAAGCFSDNPAIAAAINQAAKDILESGYYEGLPGGGEGGPIEVIRDPRASES